MELLDRMVEILGEEEITRAEFTQLLETGFAKSKGSTDSTKHGSGTGGRHGAYPSQRRSRLCFL